MLAWLWEFSFNDKKEDLNDVFETTFCSNILYD